MGRKTTVRIFQARNGGNFPRVDWEIDKQGKP